MCKPTPSMTYDGQTYNLFLILKEKRARQLSLCFALERRDYNLVRH